MKRTKQVLICFLAVFLMAVNTACNSSGNSGGVEDTITIFDGEYAEMKIIHQMVKLLVEEHTGAKVEIKDQMSPVNSYNEVLKGSADLMNSYDGTLLTTFLHLDSSDVPRRAKSL